MTPPLNSSNFQVIPIVHSLPFDFCVLRTEARQEGYLFLERLARQWTSGDMRFDRKDELLLAARKDGVTAGLGGITVDPADPDALRMRRFYVRSRFRQCGVGRALALTLLDRARRRGRIVTVNAGTTNAPAFWQALGFVAHSSQSHTHYLDLSSKIQPVCNSPQPLPTEAP